jgi:hypothetical protein
MDKVLSLLEKVSPILVCYPQWVQWFFIATFTAVLGSVFAFGIGYAGAAERRAGITADGTLPALMIAARKPRAGCESSKYVIESVSMNVRLKTASPTAGSAMQTTEADSRIVYTVFALDEVAANEFEEFAHTNVRGGAVAWIAGSESEDVLEQGTGAKKWALRTGIPKGKRRTFTTGTRYLYSEAFPQSRSVHDFNALPAQDDAFCYPNVSDVIGELTIRIESDVPLDAPQEGDALINDLVDRSIKRSTPMLYKSASEGISEYVAVARWENVLQKQIPQLRIRRM